MKNDTIILGVDIGSISISLAEVDRNGVIGRTAYAFHHGNITATLAGLLSEFDLARIGGIAATSSSPAILSGAAIYDTRVSIIGTAKRLHENVGSILIVGGEKFGLVLFDENGEYLNYRSNTSCAAGTGSFLDQQAARLNLPGIKEFSELAYGNRGAVPKIASRCAVFAKTDLIHAQQEGHSLEEICDGLSSGLVRNIADTLFCNAKPAGPMVFCGGVSKNRAVVKHFSRMLDIEIITDEYSHLYGAIGAALAYLDEGRAIRALDIHAPEELITVREREREYYYDPLALRMSEYPAFDSLERYEYLPARNDFNIPVEIDVYEELEAGKEYAVYLGIDIGSTSTKAVIIDGGRRVLAGFYTRTSGRPVAAVQAIFESLDDLCLRREIECRFLGAGTTGSGRKFMARSSARTLRWTRSRPTRALPASLTRGSIRSSR